MLNDARRQEQFHVAHRLHIPSMVLEAVQYTVAWLMLLVINIALRSSFFAFLRAV
jgi:hypothetical protein